MGQKRDNGMGTIYQRSNGSWVGKIYLGRDQSGKGKYKWKKRQGDIGRVRRYISTVTRIF